ncbi:FeMo cofactor biosynthesis protein NifB [compost metagenome]
MEAALLKHPCYHEEAHHYFARMHAPVAPKCNIQCKYCNPKFDCVNESRPGVVSKLLHPDEAFDKVSHIVSRMSNLAVVGIAGPGDPLANPQATFQTFRRIAENYPDIHLCLSTNGLMLTDYIGEIRKLNIRHVTVTVNAIDPEIGSRIYSHIRHEGILYKGKDAAELLIRSQLEGIRLASTYGILCKINSVYIPGVNGEHLQEVSKAVRKLGAFSHNIMPLILSPGSQYYREGCRTPTPAEINKVQEESSRIMPVMRHCRQCRADAVGLLGSDWSQTPDMLPSEGKFNDKQRSEFQDKLLGEVKSTLKLNDDNTDWTDSVRVAVATRGSNVINQHFGHAKEFLIYDVKNQACRLVGVRKVQAYCNSSKDCDSPMSEILKVLIDCQMLLSSGIGKAPAEILQQNGIIPLLRKGPIHEQLIESVRYLNYFS